MHGHMSVILEGPEDATENLHESMNSNKKARRVRPEHMSVNSNEKARRVRPEHMSVKMDFKLGLLIVPGKPLLQISLRMQWYLQSGQNYPGRSIMTCGKR